MKTCVNCEKQFKPSSRHKNCPKCRGERQKTPCVSCGILSNKNHRKCINCHNGSGKDSPSWRGGMTYHKKGYVMINTPERGYVFEHILVMEEFLGRLLADGETVHHLNGVKDDNRLENLELWTRPQPTGIRAKDAVAWAQEILGLYAPELLHGCISDSSEDGIRTPGQCRPGPQVH